MSSQSSRYTEKQISDLAAQEAALIQAQIDTLKNESFVRIQTIKEAHRSSEARADTEMEWKRARADAVNETVANVIRDEAEARRSNYEKMEKNKIYWEDEINNTRKSATERESGLKLETMREEAELRLKIMSDEGERRSLREDNESQARM
ncbi:hypothetical protein IFR05_012830 [Cadophora sp. M221]|nr:hypothetical protein IFR05_012830 [Cadophora sp. M221]